jgi:hypothetical protein
MYIKDKQVVVFNFIFDLLWTGVPQEVMWLFEGSMIAKHESKRI